MTPSYRSFAKFLQVHDLDFYYCPESRNYTVYFDQECIATIPYTIVRHSWDYRKEDEVIDALQVIKLFG
jgi:hypothetical protein